MINNALNRLKDINLRGHDCLVYNRNKKVVKLKDAEIWYKNGKYVQPTVVKKNENCNICCNICCIS